MKFVLKVDLNIEGNRIRQQGEFTAKKETEIPLVAYNWIRQIKMKTGFRDTKIEKVSWNEENDITDKVIEIDETPL